MAWTLVPCLVSLRAEFNALAPDRDKASDGSIADAAHVAGGTSDHIADESTAGMRGKDADDRNEVHAIDVDKDLHRDDWSMEKAVAIIVTRHRSGRDDRLQNVIYNRRIWSRSWNWTARAYTGSNPHDKHAHFSARYTTAEENDTRPWGLLEADVALTADDKTWLTAQFKANAVATWEDVAYGRDASRRTTGQLLQEARTFAADAAGKLEDLDLQADNYAAADAARDATTPERVRQALGSGMPPEQIAALLRSIPGTDWDAVKLAL